MNDAYVLIIDNNTFFPIAELTKNMFFSASAVAHLIKKKKNKNNNNNNKKKSHTQNLFFSSVFSFLSFLFLPSFFSLIVAELKDFFL